MATKDNLAFALPPKLSKDVKRMQKELKLSSPGAVIKKALSLLELSIGRTVKLESKDKFEIEINDFEGYRQTVTYESKKDE
ncbi:MAG TPA: hypothetical protein ENI23_05185 [bacterium]|nr:hypothetical protein [bacterium]